MKTLRLSNSDKLIFVDDDTFKWASKFKWSLSASGYAQNSRGYLHKMILGKMVEMVDHKDRNKLNNTKVNLRVCNKSQDSANHSKRRTKTSSLFKGVCWNKQAGKWKAYISAHGFHLHIGHFIVEEDAAIAYDRAAGTIYGEFACLNFSEDRVCLIGEVCV